MKIISYLSATALVVLGVSAIALSFSAPAIGTYSAAASLLVVLGAVRDYSPRHARWEPGRGRLTRFPAAPARRTERLAA